MPESHGPLGLTVRVPLNNRAPAGSRRTTEADAFSERLADWLTFMVPLFAAELRDATVEEVDHARRSALEQIASHGDDLQYGGRHQAASRTALAKAFAILARAEGGITALGIHACAAPHPDCPGAPTNSLLNTPSTHLQERAA